MGQAKALERRWAGPSGGMSGPGHMGLLGRDTAETLGTLPSEGVRSVSSGEEEEVRKEPEGPQGLSRKEMRIPAPAVYRCFV